MNETNPYRAPAEHSGVADELIPQDRKSPIPFHGSLTLKDSRAGAASVQPVSSTIAGVALIWLFFAAIGTTLMIVWIMYDRGDSSVVAIAVVAAMSVIGLLGVLTFESIRQRRALAQLGREEVPPFAPLDGEVDSVSIRIRSEFGDRTVRWSAFTGIRVLEDAAVLKTISPFYFELLTRSMFENDQDWIDFLHLARKQTAKP